MNREGIVLAGTVILDIVHIVDHWPTEESVAMVKETHYGAGGPPHNAAAGLVKLGADFPVTCIGAVGDDQFGRILLDQAKAYGLDTDSFQRVPKASTSHTQVMSSAATGRRTFFHNPGVNAQITPEMLRPSTRDAAIFYLGSPGIAKYLDDHDGWVQVMRHAKELEYRTALELVPVSAIMLRKHVPQILPYTDILVVNDSEAEAVAGLPVVDGSRLDVKKALNACSRLLEMGVRELACIHHPDGAVAMTHDGESFMRGSVKVETTEIVGSVGAGDAFYAGMLFGLHEGWNIINCLDLGNAAAATSLFSPTTSASIKPWKECLAFAEKRGLRTLI
jgi:sugar/nucleoside kinase (ribokinase family)